MAWFIIKYHSHIGQNFNIKYIKRKTIACVIQMLNLTLPSIA